MHPEPKDTPILDFEFRDIDLFYLVSMWQNKGVSYALHCPVGVLNTHAGSQIYLLVP